MLLSDEDLDALDTQVVASTYQGAEEVDTWYQDIAEEVSSNTRDVTYAHLVNAGKPRKWRKGTPKVFQGISRGSRKVVNDRFEMTVNADRDDLADDTTGLFRKAMTDLAFENGQKFEMVKDELASLVLLENGVGMDKAALFGTHRVDPNNSASATYANDFTGMPFTPENVAKALGIVMNQRGPDGLPRKMRPTHVLLPSALMVRGERMFGAMDVSGTTNVLRGKVQPIIAPELGDDGTHPERDETWYLLLLGGRKRPLVYQTREALKAVALFDPRDPNVWQRAELIWTASERFALAGGYPYTIYRFRP